MRLALDFPEGWRVGEGGATAGDADLAVTVALVEPLPDDPRGWLESTLRRDLAPGQTLRLLGVEAARTVSGWPVELVDVEVDAPARRALAAIYRFAEYAGLAVVSSADVAGWPALRARALPVLATGRPVWQGRYGVATLLDLWT